MIERAAKETLIRLSQQFPVVAVTGPRQSSKSTLVTTIDIVNILRFEFNPPLIIQIMSWTR